MTHDQELERLIAQTGRGDTEAFGALYEHCSRAVYAYALSILKLPAAADDVSQEAFLKIWRAAPAYAPQGRPMAWIMRIVRNLCIDELRRQPAAPLMPDSAAGPEAAVPTGDAVIQREYLRSLLESELTGEEREIVRLRVYGGLTHAEIAEALGVAAPVVRWKYAYALKKLRKRCAQDERV